MAMPISEREECTSCSSVVVCVCVCGGGGGGLLIHLYVRYTAYDNAIRQPLI